ncbi:precorrin-3b c17-methyltransferase [Thermoplasma volcanium GSS1]|uniref:Precorrin-3b c17-methyltransferase n=1 Tax=Thermoplasma volcanium (strain ATCC 51530 / DSM 4299 / JCM 9571 / NBRC 15438 / GSS1) TaxID=273116 RepID=Q97A62_THEVO|nr:precorrin-3B C(17)-methyltransferase [Thermoplasma volcanium]BAB60090.1 precorrin-3b c17-methyltransferase [Thermoplasma volcanium GSS1]
MSSLFVVGIGPGSNDLMTPQASLAIERSEYVIGFSLYVSFIKEKFPNKIYISNGMQGEIERAKKAIELARSGHNVSIISSGDAGIYGIAGAVFEILSTLEDNMPEVSVVPGISALSSCASLLGSPLSNDFMVLSLSDLLTPWEVIRKRAEAAAILDLVTVIYNPRGSRFPNNLEKVMEYFLKYRSGDTPVGIVRNAYRPDQSAKIVQLKDFSCSEIDMLTTVIIGNSETYVSGRWMATRRGYSGKYDVRF